MSFPTSQVEESLGVTALGGPNAEVSQIRTTIQIRIEDGWIEWSVHTHTYEKGGRNYETYASGKLQGSKKDVLVLTH
ncbi:uncharacterized protein TrAtP1_002944 [Trichoderma atroviride]|uniref:uncharacterized protein n=1 Tax=Hypocrea atroviridis TaxID=63577 RepID=UPI003330F503|nr:hypothetical protein TrAtP1_002944 [Trichoderma atroviride]